MGRIFKVFISLDLEVTLRRYNIFFFVILFIFYFRILFSYGGK